MTTPPTQPTTDSPPQPSSRVRVVDVVLVGLLIAFAAWVRFTHVDRDPSFDEIWHLRLSAGRGLPMQVFPADVVINDPVRVTSLKDAPGLGAIWTRMDGVLHPPLYMVALRLWREVFGESDFAAHAFSIILSLAALPFLYAAARRSMNRTIASLVVFGVAVSQTQVYLAQEIRGYALLVLIASIAVWLMTRIEALGPTRRSVTALALLTLPMLLTHYFAAGAAVAIAVYGSLRAGRFRRTFWTWLAISAAIYAVAWLPFAMRQLDYLGTGDSFLKAAEPSVAKTLVQFAGAPFRLIADRQWIWRVEVPMASSADWLLPFTGVVLVVPWFLLRANRALLPWMLWLWGSLGALVVLDLARGTTHLMFVRYLAVASPVVPLIFVGCCWAMKRSLAILVAAVLALSGAIYCFTGYRGLADSGEHGGFVRYLERNVAPGEAIVTYHGLGFDYYGDLLMFFAAHSDRLFPRPILVLSKPMTPEQMNALPRRVWLVTGVPDGPVTTLVPGATVLQQKPIEQDERVYYLELPAVDSASTRPAVAP